MIGFFRLLLTLCLVGTIILGAPALLGVAHDHHHPRQSVTGSRHAQRSPDDALLPSGTTRRMTRWMRSQIPWILLVAVGAGTLFFLVDGPPHRPPSGSEPSRPAAPPAAPPNVVPPEQALERELEQARDAYLKGERDVYQFIDDADERASRVKPKADL
jgi:hypothetical protein